MMVWLIACNKLYFDVGKALQMVIQAENSTTSPYYVPGIVACILSLVLNYSWYLVTFKIQNLWWALIVSLACVSQSLAALFCFRQVMPKAGQLLVHRSFFRYRSTINFLDSLRGLVFFHSCP